MSGFSLEIYNRLRLIVRESVCEQRAFQKAMLINFTAYYEEYDKVRQSLSKLKYWISYFKQSS